MPLNYGIKASRPGQDVKTSIDIDTMFSSKFSTLKMLAWGTATITTNGSGNGSFSYAHGLNYIPAHYVFVKGTSHFALLDSTSYTNSFVPVTQVPSNWMAGYTTGVFDAYTDASNLVIIVSGATPSTTYTFRYYLFVDLAEDYSGESGITLTNNFGMKVSKTGFDVKSAEEYNMAYSQKYKSLQYYDVNYQTQDLTLPEVNSTLFSNPTEAGTYVDFNHGLGYAPFFLAWAYNYPFVGVTTGWNMLIPSYTGYGNLGAGTSGYKAVEAFCDATRVRVSFYEKSGVQGDGINGPVYPAATITIKCVIFTENLNP